MRSASWVLLDNLSAAGIAFAFFVVSARLMPALKFGVAALAISVSQVLLSLIDSLFHDAIIQRENLQDGDVQTAFTAGLLWSVVLATVLILASTPIARAVNAPTLDHYLPWLSLSALSSGFSAVPSALCRRRMEFRRLALRTVGARVIASVVGVVLIVKGASIWGVVVQAILSSVLGTTFLLLAMRPSLRLSIDGRRLRSLLRFAGPAVGTQFLLFASSRIFTLLMSAVLGPIDAALWNVGLRFVEPLQLMAATALGQFTLPIYSRSQADREHMGVLFELGSRRASLLLVPMFAGLAACAPLVIHTLVGSRWLPAAPVLAIISLVFAIVSSRQLVEITLTSIGVPHLNLLIQTIAIVLSLIGFAVGAQFGLVGAAIGWSFRALPFIVIAGLFVRVRVGVGYRRQLKAILPTYAASGIMVLVVVTLRWTILDARSPLVGLVAAIVAGFVTYAAASLTLNRHLRSDFAAIRA